MRIAELQTRPLTEAAPTPNTIITEKDTIIAQQVSASEAELYVTDEKGKVLKVKGGSSSSGTAGAGTGTAAAQTLSEVLTTGNKLEGKEIEGDLVVKNTYTSGGNTTGQYIISGNNEGIELYTSSEKHSSRVVIGSREKIFYSTFNYPSDSPYGMGGYFYIGNKGINMLSEVTDHSESLSFNFDDKGISFGYYGDNKTSKGFSVLDSGMQVRIPDTKLGGDSTVVLSFNSDNGLSSGEYFNPTGDNQYVQKKYVDSLIGGGKIDITVDRMYLTYGGKLAVDITINGLPGNKVTDPNLFDHSTFRMKVATLTGSIQAHFTFGPTGNATIEKTYMYAQTGTVKAHIEAVLPSSTVDKWGESNPRKDIFNQTQGFFVYMPEAGMSLNDGVRSRMTNYGEVYDKRQSGVVNFKLQDGKQSTLVPSTEEYRFFAFDADTFKAEDPVDSTYSYLINNGIPIGSQDVQSGYILSDNRIMPNPAPNQVTEWDLTFKVSGADISTITTLSDYMVVVYDSENNPLEHVHFDFFNNSDGETTTARAKLTTFNKFKNIVGNGRGFKFGIKINRSVLSLNYDAKFELVNIKRTSRALV